MMLPGGTDPMYRRTLATSHRPFTRIQVFSGTGQQLLNLRFGTRDQYDTAQGSLLFYSGSVSATLGSRVARNLAFSCHGSLYPEFETDLLAPYGNIVRVYHGVELVDGSRRYVWQVFGGRIQDTYFDSASGTTNVACADFAADVLDNGFLEPRNSSVGRLCTEEVKDLILEGYPGAHFGDSDPFADTMPQLTWESDRGAALDEITKSLGALWYPLADERFVTRRIPWTVSGPPVYTFRDGPGGSVLRFRTARSRSSVYNAISVTGERADGTMPVWANSLDSNPSSPTFIDGGFGRRTRQTHLQTPGSQGQVQSVANDLLQSSKALTESWDLAIIPDASLELGEVIGIEAGNRVDIVQVVSDFQLPLDLSGPMSLSCRSQVPGLLEGD
jgi:hypothetical protein